MRIESNITAVIASLQAFKKHVPVALRRAMRVDEWLEEARQVALTTVHAIAIEGEEALIEPFVKTVMAEQIAAGYGFSLRMKALEQADNPFAKGFAAFVEESMDEFSRTFLAHRDVAYQVILEWVSSGQKDKTKADQNEDGTMKSDVQIANGLFEILFSPIRGVDSTMDDARESLLKTDDEDGAHIGGGMHLVDFFAQHPVSTGNLKSSNLKSQKRWLKAVLAAWTEMVLMRWKLRVRAELGRA